MPAAQITLRLTCGNRSWEACVPADDELTLLELLEKLSDCQPPHNCVAGACNICRCHVRGGGEFIRRAYFGRDYSDEDRVNTVLTCIAGIDRQAIAAAHEPLIHLEIPSDHQDHLNAALPLSHRR